MAPSNDTGAVGIAIGCEQENREKIGREVLARLEARIGRKVPEEYHDMILAVVVRD